MNVRAVTLILIAGGLGACSVSPPENPGASQQSVSTPAEAAAAEDPQLHLQGLAAIRVSSESLATTALGKTGNNPEKLLSLQTAYSELSGRADAWTLAYVKYLDTGTGEKQRHEHALTVGKTQIEAGYETLKTEVKKLVTTQNEDALVIAKLITDAGFYIAKAYRNYKAEKKEAEAAALKKELEQTFKFTPWAELVKQNTAAPA